MYGVPDKFHIGDLRYTVTLATRLQVPDPAGTGIIESFINTTETFASIKPLGLQTYIGSSQIDTPITHRIIFRFLDLLDTFDVVLREIQRQDGSSRQEIYRIRKISEWEGRQRFTVADCELEARSA